MTSLPPAAIEVAGRIAPQRILEDEAVLEKPARNNATALQNEFRLGPHEDGACFEHQPRGRQAERLPAAWRKTRMNSAFGKGFGDGDIHHAVNVVMGDQPAHGRDEILVVDPRDVLPAIARATRRCPAARGREAYRRRRRDRGSS